VTLFHLLLVLLAVGGVAAVAVGKVRGGLPEPTSSRPEVELPETVTAQDIDRLRFSVGFRGYRMDEVDEVLDRLSAELGARNEEIRELREHLYGGAETVVTPTDTVVTPADTVVTAADTVVTAAEPDPPPAG
jgi:DivIVA domain-containing protein